MQDTEFFSLVKRHGQPMAGALAFSLLGAGLCSWLLPEHLLMGMHVVFLVAGVMMGLLTEPSPRVDHRGTYACYFMVLVWLLYIGFSRALFPEMASVSDWFLGLMLENIVNGFCLLLGIPPGSLLRRHVRSLEPPTTVLSSLQTMQLLSPSSWGEALAGKRPPRDD